MHSVSSLSLPFVKNDADIGHKSANKIADMSVNFQSASRDLQTLSLNNCSKRGVNKNHFLLPAIKFSQLLLQQNGLESKQIRVKWTTSQKQAKDKWHQPKNLEHKQTNSHRQLALCKAMGWGTVPWLGRIWMQTCAISDLSNDSLWPRLQLVSLGPNALIAEMWEPSESVSLGFGSLNAAKRAKHQLSRRDQRPVTTCFVEPGFPKVKDIRIATSPK